ncbi:hypothetical protein Tco_1457397 [Tanacetum coccineum]
MVIVTWRWWRGCCDGGGVGAAVVDGWVGHCGPLAVVGARSAVDVDVVVRDGDDDVVVWRWRRTMWW